MKKTVLLFLFISVISLAKPVEKPTANPAIGLIMTGEFFFNGQVQFQFHIKNYGEETLTNIYVTNVNANDPYIQINNNLTPPATAIASLQPGQEDTITFYGFKNAWCFDQSQAMVHATTASNTEITDLSDDDSYYENNFTITIHEEFSLGFQTTSYQDLNQNNIVDVGDAIYHNYQVLNFNFGGAGGITIFDNNAIVDNPIGSGQEYTTTGIHYLTAEEVNLGYVYNFSTYTFNNSCFGSIPFQQNNPCTNCPNPNNANIVTKLTSLLPNSISGNVKFNANNDNCATGINYSTRRVTTESGSYSYSSFTNGAGNYSILIPNIGTYNTTANENLNANLSSNPTSVAVVSSGENQNYITDFCISSTTNYTDLSVVLIPIGQARPGFATTYKIALINRGSTNLNGTIVLTYENGKMTFNSASPAINSSTANTLTWNYSNLLPFQYRYINLDVTVAAPPTVNTGDSLIFTLVGNPIAGDAVPSDNTFTLTQPVFSSYDPNDKTVLEGSSITLAQASRHLHYLTRFQNTGTANATTVVLKETLDAKLDWNTFEPLSSSHSYNVQIRNGNELTVTYSNIDLAYSSANEPASHGYFAYRIKPKSTVVVGDSFSSDAKIYFDYNPFIQTNTVTTTINALSTSDFEINNFAVYPNPASNFITVSSVLAVDATFEISDINGKLLVNGKVENNKEIDISQLQSGFYLISINSDYQKQTFKIIKP